MFITTKHFENCHRFQIFGVGEKSINQFGLVNEGDKVFFLSKDDGLVFGPYCVTSEIFYNEEIIWEEKNGIDAYPYRVKLKYDKLFAIDLNLFSRLIELKRMRIDSGDLQQKSVLTLLPQDTCIIENVLKNGTVVEKLTEHKIFKEIKLSIEHAKSKGFTESFLEFFLLKKFEDYFPKTNTILYNQLRINLLGSKIDIIAVSEKNILVFELKKDAVDEKSAKQFEGYIKWVQNNRELLSRFFKMNLSKAAMKNFMIASGIKKNMNVSDLLFSIQKYSLENNKLTLIGLR